MHPFSDLRQELANASGLLEPVTGRVGTGVLARPVEPGSTNRCPTPSCISRANLYNLLRLDGLIPRAALCVQKLQQFLQRFRVRPIAQEHALAARDDQI